MYSLVNLEPVNSRGSNVLYEKENCVVCVDGATWEVIKATHCSSTTKQEARTSVG